MRPIDLLFGKRAPTLLLASSLALGGGATATLPVAGQTMDGTGVVATGLLLRQMDGVKRVLMIAAHPDYPGELRDAHHDQRQAATLRAPRGPRRGGRARRGRR